MTHTFAELEVSAETFHEIRRLLTDAGYAHAFHQRQGGGMVIDLHGIGLVGRPVADVTSVEVASIYGHSLQRGFVEVRKDGRILLGGLEPKKASEIGLQMIEASQAAIADEAHMRFMQDRLHLDQERAALTLIDVREIRQGTRDAVYPT